ncbi:unnamed protein product [Brugia timori]|uniref:Uncharacterized protein n=1 Tax=Brugia timori TaxID=42155 RepID=A0A0R3QK66_9BILA|nr:unnamed protein product [Brugia timori]
MKANKRAATGKNGHRKGLDNESRLIYFVLQELENWMKLMFQMGDKYEDLGPANALPPPPPQPQQILPTITPGQASQDRTELRSAQIGSSIIKKAAQGKDPKKTLVDEDEEEEIKYTTAQKTCMVISGTEKNKLERIFYLFLRTTSKKTYLLKW